MGIKTKMKNYLKQKGLSLFRRSVALTLSLLTILSLMPAFAWQSLADEIASYATVELWYFPLRMYLRRIGTILM